MVEALRAETDWRPFDDPCELAEALKLRPRPDHRVEVTTIEGDLLRFPSTFNLRRRGSQIFPVITAWLWRMGETATRDLADELIAPEDIVWTVTLPELVAMQPHALLEDLERVYHARLGSGAYTLDELAPVSER